MNSTDIKLYQKVINAIRYRGLINIDKITVRVTERVVYLEGIVENENERNEVATCVSDLFGIRSIYNSLTFPYRAKKYGTT